MKHKVLFVIGPAGSGKTTISKQIASIVGVEFISSGDIVRGLADSHKDLLQGDLYYNDDVIMGAISDKINRTDRGIVVVDGVPRTENQVAWIKGNMGENLWCVVYVDAPRIIRTKRIIKRNRDNYDNSEIVLKRISKDESNMCRIRDLCWHIFGASKVKYIESIIDGDTSSEVDRLITLLSMMEV